MNWESRVELREILIDQWLARSCHGKDRIWIVLQLMARFSMTVREAAKVSMDWIMGRR